MISQNDAQQHLKVWNNPLFGLFWKVVATPVILAGTVATLVINPLFGGLVYYGVATYARKYVEEMQEVADEISDQNESTNQLLEIGVEGRSIQHEFDQLNDSSVVSKLSRQEYKARVEAVTDRLDANIEKLARWKEQYHV